MARSGHRITRVYTGGGDKGFTSLVNGKRVSKTNLRVQAYGDVDELNSCLGIARAYVKHQDIQKELKVIQNDLFIMGADLATPESAKSRSCSITKEHCKKLEQWIDTYVEKLGPLKDFILPSGSAGGAFLHLARTVSRRAERTVVQLMKKEKINPLALVYLNRLSDYLFMAARAENKHAERAETLVQF